MQTVREQQIMSENKQQTPEETMVAIAANFFAARIVLSQPKRATAKELKTAQKTNESTTQFLSGGGYLPDNAYLEPIPNKPDAFLNVINGQDGVIPLADDEGTYTVSGDTIQMVLANFYESWFHSLKRQ
jgi:hypothetical protein